MKKLKDIKLMIQIAQQGWSEIEREITSKPMPLSRPNISVKMEKLKDLLEDIRANIEASLAYSHCSILVKVCRNFLETIFVISENLRVSYVFPGYMESYYIMDTLTFAGGSNQS